MDISSLANSLTAFLIPLLPYLLKAGDKAAEEAGKKIGGETWDKAKELWNKLRLKVETKPAAIEAVNDVAQSPDDEDAVAALRQQLKKLLNDDPTLADDIRQFIGSEKIYVQVSASGERSVAIGGNVNDSSIITGDRNIVQSSRPDKKQVP